MKSLAWAVAGLSVCGALVACASDEGGPSGGSGGTVTGGTGGSSASGGTGGSTTGGSGGSTAGGGTGGVAGSAGAATGGTGGGILDGGPPVSVTGVVTEFNPAASGAPVLVEGAQVCIKDSSLCATTDAQGVYFLPAVPSGIESALLVTKTNYVNTSVVGVVDTVDMNIDVLFPPIGIAQIFATAAGFTWPLEPNGVILAQAFETVNTDAGALLDPVAGASFSITPNAGILGPVYVSDTNFPEPTATVTSIQGWGGFGDVPVGEYVIKASKPGRNCVRGKLGWPAPNPDEARVPAIAGYIAQVIPFTCDP